MCIIICKPKGVDMPPEDWLSNSFRANDDGAGFMYNFNGEVVIEKGLFSYDAFQKKLESIPRLKQRGLVMHFRIATHGLIDAGRCHPFPVCEDYKAMEAPYSTTSLGVAHNGVLSIEPSHKHLSDTMAFIKECLPGPETLRLLRAHKEFVTLLEEYITGSRLAFLEPDGRITRYGVPWQGDKDCWFSNSSYKRYPFVEGFSSWAKPLTGKERKSRTKCPQCGSISLRKSGFCEVCKDYITTYCSDCRTHSVGHITGRCFTCGRTYDACETCGEFSWDDELSVCLCCGRAGDSLEQEDVYYMDDPLNYPTALPVQHKCEVCGHLTLQEEPQGYCMHCEEFYHLCPGCGCRSMVESYTKGRRVESCLLCSWPNKKGE